MKEKSILVVIPAYFPDRSSGGAVVGCRSFIRTLVAANYSVEVVTLDTLNDNEKIRFIDDVKVTYIPVSHSLRILSQSGWGLSLDYAAWLAENAERFDVFYFRSIWNFVSLYGSFFTYKKGIPYMFCASGKLTLEALKVSKVKKQFISFLFNKVFSSASMIHYASKQEQRENGLHVLTKRPYFISPPSVKEEKVSKDPNFINKKQKNKLSEYDLITYSVSRIDPIKRIEYAISEVIKVADHYKVCHIVLGDYSSEYAQSLISKSKLLIKTGVGLSELIEISNTNESFICFVGFMNIRDLYIKMPFNRVFIQCSYSEGMSNSILEAMYNGEDCIVSKGCNMSEVANSNAITEISVKNNNLRNLLVERIEDNNIIIMMGRKSKQYYEKNFSIQRLAKDINSVFNEVF